MTLEQLPRRGGTHMSAGKERMLAGQAHLAKLAEAQLRRERELIRENDLVERLILNSRPVAVNSVLSGLQAAYIKAGR